MGGFNGWNFAILLVAAYLAILSLVRLMRHRRDEVISELQREVERERKQAAQRKSHQRQPQSRRKPAGKDVAKAERSS